MDLGQNCVKRQDNDLKYSSIAEKKATELSFIMA